MSEQMNLREVQQRTIRLLNYEDGLWDLLLGTMFLMLSVYSVTRRLLGPTWNLVLFLVVLMLLVGGQIAARRLFSGPRLGYARSRRTPALKITLAVTVALFLATLGLVVLTLVNPGWIPDLRWAGGPDWLRSLSVDIVVMFVTVGIFSLMGYLFGIPRLFVYGWLIGVGNLASTVMNLAYGLTFNLPLAVSAGIILAIGVALLVRFVRRYPIPVQEV